MQATITLYAGSIIIKPEGKRKRTIMLPRPLAKELIGLMEAGNEKELTDRAVVIWDGCVKSSIGLWWYPPETNPDIPEAKLLD